MQFKQYFGIRFYYNFIGFCINFSPPSTFTKVFFRKKKFICFDYATSFVSAITARNANGVAPICRLKFQLKQIEVKSALD